MPSTVELYDKAIISRQPNFDERTARSEFRKVIPNLKTVAVHCFDPRVTEGFRLPSPRRSPARSTRGRSSNSSAKTEKRKSVRTPRSFRSSLRRPRIRQRATIDQHRVPPFRHRQRRHRASHGL